MQTCAKQSFLSLPSFPRSTISHYHFGHVRRTKWTCYITRMAYGAFNSYNSPWQSKMLSKRRVHAADRPAAFAVATAIGFVALGNQSVINGMRLSFFRIAPWINSSSSAAIRCTAISNGKAAAEEFLSVANSKAFNKAKAKLWGMVLFPFSTGTQPLAMASRAHAAATVRRSSSWLRSSQRTIGHKVSKGSESFCGWRLAA